MQQYKIQLLTEALKMRKKQRLIILTVAACVTAHPFFARAYCFSEAASRYGVSETLLRAIAQVESSNAHWKTHRNPDGSEDLGLMQINSGWLPALKRYGITREALMDGCTNTNIGAWILSNNIRRWGATWKAVGAYNAVTPSKQEKYVGRIWDALHRPPKRTKHKAIMSSETVSNPNQIRIIQ